MSKENREKGNLEKKQVAFSRPPEVSRQELEEKNTRLEARARQLMEILKINKILRLDLDLDDLLDKVAKAVQRSLGFHRVLISLYDRKDHVFVRRAQAGLGVEEFQQAQEQHVPENKLFQFFQEKFKISNSFFVSHGPGATAEYDLKSDQIPAGDGGWQPDNYLYIPLSGADGKLLGVMTVDSPYDGQVPGVQTVGILEMFANQAAQAVSNMMLYQQARVKARALETLSDISKQIGAYLEFDLLLSRMVEIIKTHLGCQQVAVLLWDEEQKRWMVGAPEAESRALLSELSKAERDLQQATREGKPVFSRRLEAQGKRKKLFKGSRFMAHIPLKIGGRLVGLLVLASDREMVFEWQDEPFWSSLSEQIAVAIGNAKLYQNAKNHSVTDGLTGLFNHRYFQQRLRDEESRSQRHDRPFSAIMLDIDYFKHYNDICGHPTGDRALKIIARLIKAEVRDIDILARYGGEEFAIILTETDKKGAWKVAERIRKKIGDHKFPHGQVQPAKKLTVSIGVASYPEDADNGKDLVERADEALYMAKKAGRNQVFVAGQNNQVWSG